MRARRTPSCPVDEKGVDRLSEAEYEKRAQAELAALCAGIDALDPERVAAELAAGVLTVEFWDDDQYVANSHLASRQIWLAAGRQAWRFDWVRQTEQWIAHKTDDELWSTVARVLSDKLGQSVELRRPP
jgi:CyaY protein